MNINLEFDTLLSIIGVVLSLFGIFVSYHFELNPKSWTKQSLKNVRQSKKKVCQA